MFVWTITYISKTDSTQIVREYLPFEENIHDYMAYQHDCCEPEQFSVGNKPKLRFEDSFGRSYNVRVAKLEYV